MARHSFYGEKSSDIKFEIYIQLDSNFRYVLCVTQVKCKYAVGFYPMCLQHLAQVELIKVILNTHTGFRYTVLNLTLTKHFC